MILQRLRDETQETHKRLEIRLDLLQTALSLDRYRGLLARFYGFYVPVETSLERLFQNKMPELQFPQRRKVNYLFQDLEALGLSKQQVEALPLCEGATLGGQIISRHLQSVHDLQETNGGAFFHSYGSDRGAMWRTFGTALTAYAAATEEDTIIIRAACSTFATLETWICDE
jgi:heme oxygenase